MLLQFCSADRPADHAVVAADSSKILVRQPQRDAPPGEAAATHLPTPGPQKRAINRVLVGMTTFIRIQLRVGLPVAGMLRLTSMPAAADPRQPAQHVSNRGSEGRRTVQIRTCLQHENLAPPSARVIAATPPLAPEPTTIASQLALTCSEDVLTGNSPVQKDPEGIFKPNRNGGGGKFELPTFGL